MTRVCSATLLESCLVCEKGKHEFEILQCIQWGYNVDIVNIGGKIETKIDLLPWQCAGYGSEKFRDTVKNEYPHYTFR